MDLPVFPAFIAHFPAHRKRISCYEPSREITQVVSFRRLRAAEISIFENLPSPLAPCLIGFARPKAGCRGLLGVPGDSGRPRKLSYGLPTGLVQVLERRAASARHRGGSGAGEPPGRAIFCAGLGTGSCWAHLARNNVS